jgi:hypothetical protein
MRRFFDKRATVVDVTDKEVIDLFQDSTIAAPSRTSAVAALGPSPTSRT